MAFCSACGTQIADGTTICAACSSGASGGAVAQVGSGSGITDNIAGLLCYSPVALFADILFLVLEPYNRNRFIRFHAFQSLFLGISLIVLGFGLGIVVAILAVVPVVGWILDFLLWAGFVIGNLVLWVLMMVKAYKMEKFKLPIIGDMAEKQANA